jgi:hypothetical protein
MNDAAAERATVKYGLRNAMSINETPAGKWELLFLLRSKRHDDSSILRTRERLENPGVYEARSGVDGVASLYRGFTLHDGKNLTVKPQRHCDLEASKP